MNLRKNTILEHELIGEKIMFFSLVQNWCILASLCPFLFVFESEFEECLLEWRSGFDFIVDFFNYSIQNELYWKIHRLKEKFAKKNHNRIHSPVH